MWNVFDPESELNLDDPTFFDRFIGSQGEAEIDLPSLGASTSYPAGLISGTPPPPSPHYQAPSPPPPPSPSLQAHPPPLAPVTAPPPQPLTVRYPYLTALPTTNAKALVSPLARKLFELLEVRTLELRF